MTVHYLNGKDSGLFKPLTISNGKITLEHRVVHAPLTRNRGEPLNPSSTPDHPNRIWIPGDAIVEYYSQRATKGGLIISEGIPPSLESNGMPGVPGLFNSEQAAGWKRVVNAVHAKGGDYLLPVVARRACDDPSDDRIAGSLPLGFCSVPYASHPPIEMTVEHIKQTIDDYCNAAKTAMDIGFDGVEIHCGNGYLPEQFLSSNINKRDDVYGGTPEKRCQFVFELMEQVAKTIGEQNVAIRLSPFGMFNQARGEQRIETWTHLCEGLKKTLPSLSYVSFIEPRYEQIFGAEEKDKFLKSWGLLDVTLDRFRQIFGSTPFFSAGGWDDQNSWGVVESGKYDALLYGRYFTSNPDLVHRLKENIPMAPYDRTRFYGPFEDNTFHYTDFPTVDQN
ncbi:hypothetical protein N7501_006944 [Penicillium viridicatum]|nr:hypothetical protein N7501_006944 [Penicillium viridicatum]